jgi:hypothetical protein
MNENFLESLTLDEVELIENLAGMPIENLMAKGELKGKPAKAALFVAKRRVDPNFKMEDVGKIKFAEALQLFQGVEEDPKG